MGGMDIDKLGGCYVSGDAKIIVNKMKTHMVELG